MDKNTRYEIVAHAVRWSCNILCEVLSHHGAYLSVGQVACLRQAVAALGEYRTS